MRLYFKKVKDLFWVTRICNGDIFVQSLEKEMEKKFPELEIHIISNRKKAKVENWFYRNAVIIQFFKESDEAEFMLRISDMDFNLSFEKTIYNMFGEENYKEALEMIEDDVLNSILTD